MTVGEQLQEALTNDHALLAHALFIGLRKEYWQAEDKADEIDFDRLDFAELKAMTDENVLALEKNQLYTVPLGDGLFAMYFAPDEGTVKKLHRKEFGTSCKKALLMYYGLDVSIYDPEINIHRTWREVRESMVELPAYAGLFQK